MQRTDMGLSLTTMEARRASLARPELLRSQAYYAGAWRSGEGGETVAVTDPFSSETLAEVASVGEPEIRAAIAAAQTAFATWSRTLNRDRGLLLRRWLDRPAVLRAFNIGMALLLVASLYPILIDVKGSL